jgi:hypothetical protein
MNTEAAKWDDEVETELAEEEEVNPEETIVMTEEPVNDAGADTAELQVDELIAQVESQSEDEIRRRKLVRQRLEELSEEMSLEDTYAFDIEDGD